MRRKERDRISVYHKSMENLDSNNFEQQLLIIFSITAIPQAHNKPPMSMYHRFMIYNLNKVNHM